MKSDCVVADGARPVSSSAVVLPSAMVASALSVLQCFIYAGYAADVCAAGLLSDLGDLTCIILILASFSNLVSNTEFSGVIFSHSEQLDASALLSVMTATQTLCEGGFELKTALQRWCFIVVC